MQTAPITLGRPGIARVVIAVITALTSALPVSAAPFTCTRHSAPQAPAVIELFTSEGCSSCPPADAWAARATAANSANTILLAEHVDYWDDLGWPDPFAKHEFSTRQQTYAAERRTRGVYTPQVIVSGEELSNWNSPGALSTLTVRQQPGPAPVQLTVVAERAEYGTLNVRVLTRQPVQVTPPNGPANRPENPMRNARLVLALTEDSLHQQPAAGENRDRPLTHDGVVRVRESRQATEGTSQWELHGAPGQDWQHSHLVALVQQGDTGPVLQAVSVPLGADCNAR